MIAAYLADTEGLGLGRPDHEPLASETMGAIIGLIELSREAQLVNGATFAPFVVYGCTSVLYFALCFPLTSWSRALEAIYAGIIASRPTSA